MSQPDFPDDVVTLFNHSPPVIPLHPDLEALSLLPTTLPCSNGLDIELTQSAGETGTHRPTHIPGYDLQKISSESIASHYTYIYSQYHSTDGL